MREPSGDQIGDTVYYSHRRGVSASNPYLDFDNTRGFGPEHYIARQGMSTLRTDGTPNPDGLYGTYLVKVHYYADHDEDPEEVQPISWTVHWRMLEYCAEPCDDPEVQGWWREGNTGGQLTAANSGSARNIDNNGPEWSDAILIDYPRPDPNAFEVLPSYEVMLP